MVLLTITCVTRMTVTLNLNLFKSNQPAYVVVTQIILISMALFTVCRKYCHEVLWMYKCSYKHN